MNQTYSMALAKRDFENGVLKKFRIERNPMGNDWVIFLGEGKISGYLVDFRLKQTRVFKTLDASVAALNSIGFAVTTLS